MSDRPRLLYLNGRLVPYADARVHVLSSAFKYAIVVFEGLRAYWSEDRHELYGFRFRAHFDRLLRSMEVARMEAGSSAAELEGSLIDLIRANDLEEDLHLRVLVFVDEDDGRMGSVAPISVAMAAMPMRRYFAREGVHVQISSWTRISEADMPPRVKASANYHNSRLALLQAKADGYDDAVFLGPNRKVAEGPGYNILAVLEDSLVTPPESDGILPGITRDSLIRIARDLGMTVAERSIDRTELYVADELFFCGSAAEVTPILSVDRHIVGTGRPGRITSLLRERYVAAARGDVPAYQEWLTPVYQGRLASGAAQLSKSSA